MSFWIAPKFEVLIKIFSQKMDFLFSPHGCSVEQTRAQEKPQINN